MPEISRPERRSQARSSVCLDLEFQVWDSAQEIALTPKVPGRLTNISSKGACLEIRQPLIGGFHLMRDNDPDGNTPLLLHLPARGETTPFSIRTQVLWYNRIDPAGPFHFRFGLKFLGLSSADRKEMEDLLRSLVRE